MSKNGSVFFDGRVLKQMDTIVQIFSKLYVTNQRAGEMSVVLND